MVDISIRPLISAAARRSLCGSTAAAGPDAGGHQINSGKK